MTKITQKMTLKMCVCLTIIAGALFLFINFSPLGTAGLQTLVPKAELLDFQFGFSQEKAYEVLTHLGKEGRIFYSRMIWLLDFVFPLSYGIAAFSWIAYFLNKLPLNKLYSILLFLPLTAMLFDWLENVGILLLLSSFPDLSAGIVGLSSNAGLVKWIASAASLLTILILAMNQMVKKK